MTCGKLKHACSKHEHVIGAIPSNTVKCILNVATQLGDAQKTATCMAT